jgi:hypothetical protein
VSFETVNVRCPQQWAKQKMQAKHSTTEGRHDGIGIPSATRPFAVANKNKQNKKTDPMKTIKHLTYGALAVLAVLVASLLFQTSITRADAHGQKGAHGQRGGDKAPQGHGHTLHLRAYFTSFHSTQAGAGLAVGDQLTFGGTLARIESPNEQIGSVGAHFAVTAPGGG